MHQVVDQGVDRLGVRSPLTGGGGQRHALLQTPFLADHHGYPRDLARDAVLLSDGLVERVCDAPVDASPVRREPDGEIAIPECD